MSRFLKTGCAAALLAALAAPALRADDPPKPAAPAPVPSPKPEDGRKLDVETYVSQARGGGDSGGFNPMSRYRNFNDLIQGSERIDGLFTLHKKDEHLFAEIKPFQFDQPLLLPTTIARGLAQAGMPIGDGEIVLVFHKNGDKVQLIRRNIRYKASNNAALEKSVKQNYTDSVLMSLPILAMNPAGGMSTVIDFSDIFLTNFAQLPFGFMDRSRSGWHRVKGFTNNLELEVEATFAGGGRGGFGGDDGVADSRGITLVIHYSLMKAPDMAYRPRFADDRVGHFLDTHKDFSISGQDGNFVRLINRWRLEKADPRAKLSPPKKQIVWYIEDTVPIEFRPHVEAGIREWNKAFEKVGIREAIAVRWAQEGRDEFDPEDTNYCTFRWVTSDAGFAMSCFRSNPMTGEIIDGDVVFDASFLRAWKSEYALLVNAAGKDGQAEPIASGEVISPILAGKSGFGSASIGTVKGFDGVFGRNANPLPELIPAEWGPLQYQLTKQSARGTARMCGLRAGLTEDFGLASLALAEPGKDGTPPGELPEEFLAQALKETVMHEVGHSLGLRHNFKASTMLPADQLHDPNVTRQKGLVGSVMDYNPVNLAPKGTKQGDYYTTTLGPYDYWAIEYAYSTIHGDEAAELKKIASRAPEAGLSYATDEDLMLNSDPQVNQWDLGNDPCKFGKDRIALASELLKDLDAKVVKDGESWTRNRRAFSTLLRQYGNGAELIAAHIGGQSVHRDHKGDKDARDPIVPIAGAKQRECLNALVESVLSDGSFQFSPALLRRLAVERWTDWSPQGGSGVDFPFFERILAIQKIALNRCLNPRVLARLENQALQADPGTDPLRMDEVFRSLSDGIWSELNVDPKAAKLSISTIRRNLQREYTRRLIAMVLGDRGNAAAMGDLYPFVQFNTGSLPADARALARLHLRKIAEKIHADLDAKNVAIDDTTRAHLEETQHRISKALDAQIGANEP